MQDDDIETVEEIFSNNDDLDYEEPEKTVSRPVPHTPQRKRNRLRIGDNNDLDEEYQDEEATEKPYVRPVSQFTLQKFNSYGTRERFEKTRLEGESGHFNTTC